jgi:hypothetical protein
MGDSSDKVCRNMQAEAERHPTVESAREEWHRLQTFGAATAYMRALEAEVERLRAMLVESYQQAANAESELAALRDTFLQTDDDEALWRKLQQAEAKVERMEANSYPHMCQDDHPRIGHSTDNERCPVCLERARAEQAEAELAALKALITELVPFIGYEAYVPDLVKRAEDAVDYGAAREEGSDG